MKYLESFSERDTSQRIGFREVRTVTKDILIDLDELEHFQYSFFHKWGNCAILRIFFPMRLAKHTTNDFGLWMPIPEEYKSYESILERLFDVYRTEGLLVYNTISQSMVEEGTDIVWFGNKVNSIEPKNNIYLEYKIIGFYED